MYSQIGLVLIILGVCGVGWFFFMYMFVVTTHEEDKSNRENANGAGKVGLLLIGTGVVVAIAGAVADSFASSGFSIVSQLMIMVGLSLVGLFLAYHLFARAMHGNGKNKPSANLAGKIGAILLIAGVVTSLIERIGYALLGK
jgi:uncharacterized membrane protein